MRNKFARYCPCIAALIILYAHFEAKASNDFDLRIRQIIYNEVESRLDVDSMSMVMDIPAPQAQSFSSSEVKKISMEWTKANDQLRGRVVLPVRIYDQNLNSYIVYVRADILWFKKVCVSAARINRHQLFNDSAVLIEMRDISDLTGEPFICISDIEGMRSRHLIQSGRIITQNMTEMPPLIRRGEKVTIRMIKGRLLVTSSGIARQDGWLGDEIRIRTPQNQQEIKATVAGSQTADLYF